MSFESSPSSFSKAVVETTLLINSSNPKLEDFDHVRNSTIVGTWDLSSPSTKEAASIRVRTVDRRSLETLGPDGDHRTKVPDITGPKEYRAICKLFMSYIDGGSDEFIGTGWLIGTDIIATAGHCLYDSAYNGGYLRYIKCYFGYQGPASVGSCVYRWGIAAAAPAEYLKSPSSEVHDVGFIRLNEPVQGIDPLTYNPTPALAESRLGVVGYPGDVDFGHTMYEHWANVQIDLAKTGNLLAYKVDTTPGNSGSPVLRKLGGGKVDVVGVHVAGGYPNIGSVIGPLGNRFEEYILALNVKKGYQTTSASVVSTAGSTGKPVAPGFQLISIKPSATLAESYINPGHGPSASLSPESTAALSESQRAVVELFGQTKENKKTNGVRKRPTATGQFLKFPESLIVPGPEADLPAPDYDKAIANAKQQDDIQTIFFVDFPLELEGQALTDLQNLQKSVQSWQAWSSTICEGKVQQQIDAKALPGDNKGQFARSTYRAKVFDYLFRRSTWFAKTFDQAMSKHIETKTVEFHSEILTKVLEGFSIPTSVYSTLELLLNQISNGIKLSKSSGTEAQQYWIMLTKYNYQSVTKTVQTVVRVIQFQVSQEAQTYTSNKASYESISFDLQFSQYQADFNNDIYSQIRTKIDQKLIDDGLALVQNKTMEIPV